MAQILLWDLLTSRALITQSKINYATSILKSLGLNPIHGPDFTLGSVDSNRGDYLRKINILNLREKPLG